MGSLRLGKSLCPGVQQPRPMEAPRMDFVWPAPHCSEWKKASHLAKISSVVTIVLKEAELNRGPNVFYYTCSSHWVLG